VNELFEATKKWDTSASEVPIVVERLVALKDVHQQSVDAINSIRQVQSNQSAVSEILSGVTQGMEQVTNYK
jgi:hypothetical protein